MVNVNEKNISEKKKPIIKKIENEEYITTSLVEDTTNSKEDINNDKNENKKSEQIKKNYENNPSLESSLGSDSENSENFENLLKNVKVINISSFNKNELNSGKRKMITIKIFNLLNII